MTWFLPSQTQWSMLLHCMIQFVSLKLLIFRKVTCSLWWAGDPVRISSTTTLLCALSSPKTMPKGRGSLTAKILLFCINLLFDISNKLKLPLTNTQLDEPQDWNHKHQGESVRSWMSMVTAQWRARHWGKRGPQNALGRSLPKYFAFIIIHPNDQRSRFPEARCYAGHQADQVSYGEDSINGTPFVQSLVSHSHKFPTYKLRFVWILWIMVPSRPSHLHENPFIYCPTYRVLTVLCDEREDPRLICDEREDPRLICVMKGSPGEEVCLLHWIAYGANINPQSLGIWNGIFLDRPRCIADGLVHHLAPSIQFKAGVIRLDVICILQSNTYNCLFCNCQAAVKLWS